MATYGLDICFNLDNMKQKDEYKDQECLELDPIMEPVYKKWGAKGRASEYGPLFGDKKDVERIIVVSNIKTEFMDELLEYFKNYDFIRLRWFTKSCGDDDDLDNRHFFSDGLPKNHSVLDEIILNNYVQK